MELQHINFMPEPHLTHTAIKMFEMLQKQQADHRNLTEARPSNQREDHLKKLWEEFHAMGLIQEQYNGSPDNAIENKLSDALVVAQGPIIEAATQIRADTLIGVLYKFAILRWDWSELDASDLNDLMRYERLGLSTFIDFAELMGMDSVLKPRDRVQALSDS